MNTIMTKRWIEDILADPAAVALLQEIQRKHRYDPVKGWKVFKDAYGEPVKLTKTPFLPATAGAIAALADQTGRTLFGALQIVVDAAGIAKKARLPTLTGPGVQQLESALTKLIVQIGF
jgi:hypothetical protein